MRRKIHFEIKKWVRDMIPETTKQRITSHLTESFNEHFLEVSNLCVL